MGEAPRAGGSVRIGFWSAPKGVFNPLFAEDAADQEINSILFETLLSYGLDLGPRPNLARSFTVSPDQRTIMFWLHPAAFWHDGRPVSAADVEFTLRTVLSKDYAGPYAGKFRYIKGATAFSEGRANSVEGVRVSGDGSAIAVIMDKPYGPALMEIGSLPVLPQHVFRDIAVKDMAKAAPTTQRPIASGPFILVAAGADGVRLWRNHRFFGGLPYLDSLEYVVLGSTVDVGDLRGQGIDVVRLRPEHARVFEKMGDFSVFDWPGAGYFYLAANLDYRPFHDRQVRQALAYALDREAMAGKLFAGYATLVNSSSFPGSWGEGPGLNEYEIDLMKARSLMYKAGWGDSDGDGLLDQNGKEMAFNLFYPKDKPTETELAGLIQDQIKLLGVKIHLHPLETPKLMERVFRSRTFDLYLLSWSLTPDPDVTDIFGPGPAADAIGFKDARARELLKHGNESVVISRRQPYYQAWSRMANEDLPYIFLFTRNEVAAVSSRLRGIEVGPMGYTGSVERWWVTGE